MFSGCGGSSLGYQRAGCKTILACDFNPAAIETYRLNFPETNTIIENIRNMNYDKIHTLTGIKKGELDILDGSPPCTPFSMAGDRENTWGRSYKHSGESKIQRTDDLFFEFIRLIEELMPKTFIAENVSGLIKGKAKIYYNEIVRQMKKIGYNIQSFLLNAKDFEVAQTRQRVIITGIRNDIIPNPKAKLIPHKPISFIEAVRDLKIPEDEMVMARTIQGTQKQPYLHYIKQGESFNDYHPKQHWFNYCRASLTKPCPTITTHSNEIMHPLENRWLTVSELKRLSSFPDTFKFLSLNEGHIRIGNSVPPNLIKHVVTYLIKKAGLS